MVYRGESVDLSCPGASQSPNAYWRKQEYKAGEQPLVTTRVASYLSAVAEADRINVSADYEARGVTMSNTSHLHFPEIQLSDEGVYICDLTLDVPYHVVELEVSGRFLY